MEEGEEERGIEEERADRGESERRVVGEERAKRDREESERE